MALNKDQERVYEWLNDDLRLPVFAEAYRGAVCLLSQESAGHISFVAHAGRELMNQLALTYNGVRSKQVQYQNRIDKLQNMWKVEWGLTGGLSTDVTTNGHLIPIKVCQEISSLIEDHKSGRERSSQADALFFSTFLRYSDKHKIPSNFLSEWTDAKAWFLSHAHLRKKPFDTEAKDDLIKHFNCLDSYLYIAASSQYARLKDLNEILDETNQ